MKPRTIDPSSLASVLPPGGLIYVQGCSGESRLLAEAVRNTGAAIGAATFTGIFVPALNRSSYFANPGCRVRTFFMTPELSAANEAVEFLPLCYADISHNLAHSRIDAALFTVAPPDDDGNCSFGSTVDFLADLWPHIPVRLAHINPAMPKTHGHPGIPFRELTAIIEAHTPLLGMQREGDDPGATEIGRHVSSFIGDGATLQMGLGKIPNAVLRSLCDRRKLRIHSGLIGDAVLDLLAAGAVSGHSAITAGVAIGSIALYDAIKAPEFSFRSVTHTHNARVMADIPNFVSINSALDVDIFGQAYAEFGPRGPSSGPGGATDFARGAKAAGGLRIVALPSTAHNGTIGRIVPPGQGSGPVSLGRTDIDVVVTEHGAADLRGLGYHARAERLIGIAAPAFKSNLDEEWRRYARQKNLQ